MEQDYSWYYNEMMVAHQETEHLRQVYVAFNGLKGELRKEGDQWCATCGEWPEHNISGFGKTPANAMWSWWTEYNTQLTK